MVMLSQEEIWHLLDEIPDPDIPVISITELGLVKDVTITDDKVIVTVTPSYSGCPAMQLFKDEIISTLKNNGVEDVEVKTVYHPAWSTDLLSNATKEKMKKHGIAPPIGNAHTKIELFADSKAEICCPWCNSNQTNKTSQFGSTPCKALWFCNSCKQPFEYFKCI